MTDKFLALATVWVVERGCYEERYVEGVYATVDAAIAANPPPEDYRLPSIPTAQDSSRPGGWQQIDANHWSNGLDWDNAATATLMEVRSGIEQSAQ